MTVQVIPAEPKAPEWPKTCPCRECDHTLSYNLEDVLAYERQDIDGDRYHQFVVQCPTCMNMHSVGTNYNEPGSMLTPSEIESAVARHRDAVAAKKAFDEAAEANKPLQTIDEVIAWAQASIAECRAQIDETNAAWRRSETSFGYCSDVTSSKYTRINQMQELLTKLGVRVENEDED